MFISLNWISDFVDLSGLDKNELIHKFSLSTAEVENEIFYKGSDLSGVVVAEIKSIEDHPESKKLHLLKVDAGDKIYDVVCGAPNVREGMIVAFAREGGKVGGMDILCASIAGCESHGMCCSEKELGISADHSGLWEITDKLPLGTQLTDAYQIKDIVFEVDNKSLTNRPDLWGHYGIAREFAALTGRELKPISRGVGAVGLPGDLSSPSRFVRAAFTRFHSRCEEDREVSQFFHLLGSVEQVRGCCRLEDGSLEHTLYTSCCDAARGIYYYTTYGNRRITGIDMNRENLNGSTLVRFPLLTKEDVLLQN